MHILFDVDPLSEDASHWNPYRYGFNNPIKMIDSDGLFENEVKAKEYAKLNWIKTGWFRSHKISQQNDGTYAITKGGHIKWSMVYNPNTKEVLHMQPMK